MHEAECAPTGSIYFPRRKEKERKKFGVNFFNPDPSFLPSLLPSVCLRTFIEREEMRAEGGTRKEGSRRRIAAVISAPLSQESLEGDNFA